MKSWKVQLFIRSTSPHFHPNSQWKSVVWFSLSSRFSSVPLFLTFSHLSLLSLFHISFWSLTFLPPSSGMESLVWFWFFSSFPNFLLLRTSLSTSSFLSLSLLFLPIQWHVLHRAYFFSFLVVLFLSLFSVTLLFFPSLPFSLSLSLLPLSLIQSVKPPYKVCLNSKLFQFPKNPSLIHLIESVKWSSVQIFVPTNNTQETDTLAERERQKDRFCSKATFPGWTRSEKIHFLQMRFLWKNMFSFTLSLSLNFFECWFTHLSDAFTSSNIQMYFSNVEVISCEREERKKNEKDERVIWEGKKKFLQDGLVRYLGWKYFE